MGQTFKDEALRALVGVRVERVEFEENGDIVLFFENGVVLDLGEAAEPPE